MLPYLLKGAHNSRLIGSTNQLARMRSRLASAQFPLGCDYDGTELEVLQNKVQPALEHLADGKRLSGGADCALAHYLSGFG